MMTLIDPATFKKESIRFFFFCEKFLINKKNDAQMITLIESAVTYVPAVPLHLKKESIRFFFFCEKF